MCCKTTFSGFGGGTGLFGATSTTTAGGGLFGGTQSTTAGECWVPWSM